jgi:cytochrome c2
MRTASVLATILLVASSARADGVSGKAVFRQCQACHALDEMGSVETGPTLYDLFGKKVATRPNYAYSDSMKKSDVVWTPETLDAFLKNPQGVMPGNKMPFAGVKNPDQRKALVTYLQTATAPK